MGLRQNWIRIKKRRRTGPGSSCYKMSQVKISHLCSYFNSKSSVLWPLSSRLWSHPSFITLLSSLPCNPWPLTPAAPSHLPSGTRPAGSGAADDRSIGPGGHFTAACLCLCVGLKSRSPVRLSGWFHFHSIKLLVVCVCVSGCVFKWVCVCALVCVGIACIYLVAELSPRP